MEIPRPTRGQVQTERFESQAASIAIPGDKFRVVVQNAGNAEVNGTPGNFAPITVNGDALNVGGQLPFETVFDRANNQELLTQPITISNPGGATVWYFVTE